MTESSEIQKTAPHPVSRLLLESRQPVRSLLDFWDVTRLRVASARSSSARRSHDGEAVGWHDALRDILRVGYGLRSRYQYSVNTWRCKQHRTLPSAGALYPFEIFVCTLDPDDKPCNYLYDVSQGVLLPHASDPLTPDEAQALRFQVAEGEDVEALMVLVARPWTSMKKYRLRGYVYCHLDIGHAAANLAVYASAMGYSPNLHLRFDSEGVANRLGLADLCREPLVALSFARQRPTDRPASAKEEPKTWWAAPVSLTAPEPIEIENWKSLEEFRTERTARPVDPRVEHPLVRPEGSDPGLKLAVPPADPTLKSVRTSILERRSAKGFHDGPLTQQQIGHLLSAMREDTLRTDCPSEGAPGLGVRIVARRVDGLHGVYAYDHQAHALVPVGESHEEYDFRSACMQQQMVATSSALLLFHAPIREMIDRSGFSAFAELHFHAGRLAQHLYLAAGKAGVGMTCVGGFDDSECFVLACLDRDDEVLYVVVLGIADETAIKEDRLRIAYSHGHTS